VQYRAGFVEKLDRPQVWRHDLGAEEYQDAFEAWGSKGYGFRLLAGAGVGSKHRYAAVWQR